MELVDEIRRALNMGLLKRMEQQVSPPFRGLGLPLDDVVRPSFGVAPGNPCMVGPEMHLSQDGTAHDLLAVLRPGEIDSAV